MLVVALLSLSSCIGSLLLLFKSHLLPLLVVSVVFFFFSIFGLVFVLAHSGNHGQLYAALSMLMLTVLGLMFPVSRGERGENGVLVLWFGKCKIYFH